MYTKRVYTQRTVFMAQAVHVDQNKNLFLGVDFKGEANPEDILSPIQYFSSFKSIITEEL